MKLAAALGAAAALLGVAAPASAQGVGYDVTCAAHAHVQLDRATGAYTLDGIGSPCDVVMIDGVPRAERATITGSGTVTGDPCASATWTGRIAMTFRWRAGFSDFPLAGTSTGPLLALQGVRSARRVTATFTLSPRTGTCAGDSFLALGRMTVDYFGPLWQLP